MTRLQKILLAFLPAHRRADNEAKSRQWKIIREACGHETSVWDLGGVRYGALGKSLTWGRYKACGKRGRHTLRKDTGN